jgi:nucleoside-diphosphate-sugar epimerase
MNILITGVLGHIGSSLLENISKIRNLKKVYLIDSTRSNNLNVLFNLKKSKVKLNFIEGDLLDDNVLKKVKDNINVVIHLASITNAEASFKFKNLIYKNNLGIFKKICNFCLKKKAKLIHLSSTSVYGSQSSLVDENCNFLKPQSPYADVKLLEEKYLKKKENNKLKYMSLRLGTITGVSKGMRFHTAVNKFCYKTILKEEVPIWNNAMDQYRPYLSLSDAIKTFIYIINNNFFNRQIYNVLTNNYTVREILKIIKNNNFFIRIKKTKSPILNQNSYKVSDIKIKKLKINFNKDINTDIKETLALLKRLY